MKISEIMNNVVEVAINGYVSMIRGLHGTGKSESVERIAGVIGERLNRDVILHTVDMSHIKEGELTGMPITETDSDTGCKVNMYTTYGLFNNVIKEAKEGYIPIIFFDEINRADRVVFNELMPIILNKRVQELELPKETIIIAAGNPEDITKYKGATDDYSVLPMDPALKDRFFIFELDVDPVEWLKWANEKDEEGNRHVHDDVIEFISEYPNMLHFLSNSEINPTPRAWKMFSDVYSSITKGKSFEVVEDSIVTLGGGKIGVDTTVNFLRFIKSNKNPLLKPQDFFSSKINEKTFDENLKKLAADTPTRQYISINNITEYYAEKLESCKTKQDKDELVNKYCMILVKMPNDILIGTLKEMLENNKKALNEITKRQPKMITDVQKYLI